MRSALEKSYSNPLSSPNMFKDITKRLSENNVANKDKGTAFDKTSVNSVQSEVSDPLAHMKSDVQSAEKNVLQGSKTVLTNLKRNDEHNINSIIDKLGVDKSTPSNSLFEDTALPRVFNIFEERAFGEPVKPTSSIKHQTDGIIGDNKVTTIGLNKINMSQKNQDKGLKVNRYLNNAKTGNLTQAGTPRINRELDCSNPINLNHFDCRSKDNTKLKPEIKPIG
jgi:hypothetical protein